MYGGEKNQFRTYLCGSFLPYFDFLNLHEVRDSLYTVSLVPLWFITISITSVSKHFNLDSHALGHEWGTQQAVQTHPQG